MTPSLTNLKHLAIIMDGNGRWAKDKNLDRIVGHKEGAKSAKKIIETCSNLNIKYLTLYTFSTENWDRPQFEVDSLMALLSGMLNNEIKELERNNIVFRVVGRVEDLPKSVQKIVSNTVERTKNNTGLVLSLALSYGGRQEIIDAMNKILKNKESKIIDEEIVKNHLYFPEMPDPDLIIRTGGEFRLSNFLLWQSAYSEVYISKKNWPDFKEKDLMTALEDFNHRNRTFGKLTD
ncbi:MAG: isoprenyl transferase [Gammaproteobacteria bacterium]|nr:isoprenyl transferase [Gammaproteobacteria bacterium]MBT6867527.1 isoprenyl transferase [Candidatus Neomarinimicrobiota bacterium]MBT7172577.1 isoprenyl transferase [Candidatus Neomarinimicrobiota bacterium]MBT7434259.1 isoprenyl transferase [Candidatus Neomarinimicrobiota bacterium]MDC0917492.1 isoprenyl transferase [Candidatus Neomarinimicrobiota bacterium]